MGRDCGSRQSLWNRLPWLLELAMKHSNQPATEGRHPYLQQHSDSLISGLCREMEVLRNRCDQLAGELSRSREEALLGRLRKEMKTLHLRQQALQRCVGEMRRGRLRDSLLLEFLEELTLRRPSIS